MHSLHQLPPVLAIFIERVFIAVICFTAVAIGVTFASGAEPKPTGSAPAAEQKTPVVRPAEESPLPLVVRVDKSALQPYTDSDRDVDQPVDKWVLGACRGR
ncbi:MAG: hypothetical protein QM775_26875 [Pirellulales bacterium]